MMFSRAVPSSPILELNTLNFPNFISDLEPLDSKMTDAEQMAQYYMAQQKFVANELNDLKTRPGMQNGSGLVDHNDFNYQYSVLPQQVEPPQDLEGHFNNNNGVYSFQSIFNDTSFLSPQFEDVPGTSTSASTSVTSELDSLNLQFIHLQDVVNFPSVHACNPPTMEDYNDSRRGSILEQQQQMLLQQMQHTQAQQQLHQQQIMPQQMPLPTLEDILSSVETTPLMQEVAYSSMDEATQLLPAPIFTMKSEPDCGSFNFGSTITPKDEFDEEEIPDMTDLKKLRVVRGVSSGGCSTRPPKEAKNSSSHFAKVRLHLSSAGLEDVCLPAWNKLEKADRRRIIRIERRQNREHIVASFSIVGSALEHPEPAPAEPGVEVLEVSCLETIVDEDYDDFETRMVDSENDETIVIEQEDSKKRSQIGQAQYYITSVEVIRIVELLIGTEPLDGANRRRERGRVRSNLVPFWSRKPVSSKKSQTEGSPIENENDFRVELAQRIMGYETRKPRGFDKEVRILKWEKLVPALKRALQSYYVEIPESEF